MVLGVNEPIIGTPLWVIHDTTNEDVNLCPECGRHFGSKAGVSLHQTAQHLVEYNRDILSLVSSRNKFWTKGEVYTMASEELVWRTNRLSCGVNEFIQCVTSSND